MAATIKSWFQKGEFNQRVWIIFTEPLSGPRQTAFQRRMNNKYRDEINRIIWRDGGKQIEIEIKRTCLKYVRGINIKNAADRILKRI